MSEIFIWEFEILSTLTGMQPTGYAEGGWGFAWRGALASKCHGQNMQIR